MALDGVVQAGTNALQKSLDNLQRNANEVAQQVRADNETQEQTTANAEAGVQPAENEGSVGSIKPSSETERLASLLVEQAEISNEFDAIAQTVSTTGKLIGNFIDEFA